MNKVFVGILIGIFLCATVTFMYRTYWLRDFAVRSISVEKVDTSKTAIATCVMQIKGVHANYEEKFNSINKRLDDFLVFGGMIITLLLAVTVSVYLKTEAEVNKHLKENFETYETRIIEFATKAEQSAAQTSAYEELARKKSKNIIDGNSDPIK